jgi:hypothetical protein
LLWSERIDVGAKSREGKSKLNDALAPNRFEFGKTGGHLAHRGERKQICSGDASAHDDHTTRSIAASIAPITSQLRLI